MTGYATFLLERIKSIKSQHTETLHMWLKELGASPEPDDQFDLDFQNAAMVMIRSELVLRKCDEPLERTH